MGKLVLIQQALDDLGLEKEDFIEIVQELKSFTKKTLPKLKVAISTGNFNDLEKIAHSIKGSFKNLRFIEVGKIAENLEIIGSGSLKKDPVELFNQLEKSIEASFAEVGNS